MLYISEMATDKDEVEYCPVCDYTVKKYRFKQHTNSKGHQYLLDMCEAGIKVDKPDRTTTDKDGKLFCGCDACREIMLKCMWGSHIASKNHKDCKEENMETKTKPYACSENCYLRFFYHYIE